MTLSAWFRDYLFIPLGGSRKGTLRTYCNLICVFVLCGFWHGAAWTFILWGVYHGALLILERVSDRRYGDEAPWPLFQRASTLLLVMLGWVLFRANNLTHALAFYAALLGSGSEPFSYDLFFALTTKNTLILCLASLVFVFPSRWRGGVSLESGTGPALALARAALLLLALPYLTVLIMSGTFSPFLYFQF